MIAGQFNGTTDEVLEVYSKLVVHLKDYEAKEFHLYNTLVKEETCIKFTFEKKEEQA